MKRIGIVLFSLLVITVAYQFIPSHESKPILVTYQRVSHSFDLPVRQAWVVWATDGKYLHARLMQKTDENRFSVGVSMKELGGKSGSPLAIYIRELTFGGCIGRKEMNVNVLEVLRFSRLALLS